MKLSIYISEFPPTFYILNSSNEFYILFAIDVILRLKQILI